MLKNANRCIWGQHTPVASWSPIHTHHWCNLVKLRGSASALCKCFWHSGPTTKICLLRFPYLMKAQSCFLVHSKRASKLIFMVSSLHYNFNKWQGLETVIGEHCTAKHPSGNELINLKIPEHFALQHLTSKINTNMHTSFRLFVCLCVNALTGYTTAGIGSIPP